MSGVAEEVVLDANVLVALADDRDALHVRARGLYARLEAQGALFVLADFLVAEFLSVIARRAHDRDAWGVEHDVILARYIAAESAGEIRPLAAQGYTRFASVLEVLRATAGRLNAHDAMIVVLQRDEIIGPRSGGYPPTTSLRGPPFRWGGSRRSVARRERRRGEERRDVDRKSTRLNSSH